MSSSNSLRGETTASDLLDALGDCDAERVAQLLSRGVDPNGRPHSENTAADNVVASGPDNILWVTRDPAVEFRQGLCSGDVIAGVSYTDRWYPIQHAASLWSRHDRSEECERVIAFLLKAGADLYATFVQPLRVVEKVTRSLFPGQDARTSLDEALAEEDGHNNASGGGMDSWEDSDEEDSVLPAEYHPRVVIHAILEDGLFVKPFLEQLGSELDLERRDLQGRTLFLSACRSILGADASLDGVWRDVTWNPRTGGYNHDPFQPSGDEQAVSTPMHALLRLGADPLAMDKQGKHALHQLLEANDCNPGTGVIDRPPIIRRSLMYLATTHPELLNKPDLHGTYPIHAALRRLRRYPNRNSYVEKGQVELVIRDLITAGANVRAKDGMGNTVLHYLADEGLAESWHGDETRSLFYTLLEDHGCAPDINVPNAQGLTPIQLLLDDDGTRAQDRDHWYGLLRSQPNPPFRHAEEIDKELVEKLDAAGVDWSVRDGKQRSLLHIVGARTSDLERARWRFEFLIQKGLAEHALDTDGRSPRDPRPAKS